MQDDRQINTKCLCHIEKICQACDSNPCVYGRQYLLKTEVACKESESHSQCKCCKCIKCPVSVIKRLCQLAMKNGEKPDVAKERYSVFEGGRSLNFDKKPHLDGRGDFIFKRKPKSSDISSDEIKPKGKRISPKSGPGAKTRSPQRRRVTVSISDFDLALKTPKKKKKSKADRGSLDFPSSANDGDLNERVKAEKDRKKVRDTEVESEPYSRKGRKSRVTTQESDLSYIKRKSGMIQRSKRRDQDYQDNEMESDVPRAKAMRTGRTGEEGRARKTYSESDKGASMDNTEKRKTKAHLVYDETDTFKRSRSKRRSRRDYYSDEEAEKPSKTSGASADRESEGRFKRNKRIDKAYADEYEDEGRKYPPRYKGRKSIKHDIGVFKSKIPDDITSWSSEDDNRMRTKKRGKERIDDGVGRPSRGKTHKIPRPKRPRSEEYLQFSPSTSVASMTGKPRNPRERSLRPPSEDEDYKLYRKPRKPKDPGLWSENSFERKQKKRQKGAEKRKPLEKVSRDLLIPEDSEDITRKNKDSPRGSEDKSTMQVSRRKWGRKIPGHRSSIDEFRTVKKIKCLPMMPTRFGTGTVSDWMRLRLEVSDQKRLKELCRRPENKFRSECKEFNRNSCDPDPSYDSLPPQSDSLQVKNACNAINPLSYCFI